MKKLINIKIIELTCSVCKSKIKKSPEIFPDINPITYKKIKKENWEILKKIEKKNFFFPYYRCKCGLLTNKYFFNKNSLKYLYSDMNENIHSNDTEENALKTKYEYLNQLKDILLNKKSFHLLEIGADNGDLQKLILGDFGKLNLTVIEPNKRMHLKLRKICNYVYSDISEIPKNKKFDLIIGIHVFDHIPNFSNFLRVLRYKLKDNGQIYGVVHNEKSLMARIFKEKWPAYCLQHPNLFNEYTLTLAFEKLNFKKKFIKKTINFFNLGFLFQHLFVGMFGIKIRFPSFFSIGLKLGNFSFLFSK